MEPDLAFDTAEKRQKRRHVSWRGPHIAEALLELFQVNNYLDAGCGLGDIAAAMVDLGVDAYGLDSSYEGAEWIELPPERYVIEDLRRPFDLGRRVDLVTCFDMFTVMPQHHHSMAKENLRRLSDTIIANGIEEIVGYSDNLTLAHLLRLRLSQFQHRDAFRAIFRGCHVFRRKAVVQA